MHFEVLGEITGIEVIAVGRGIRRLKFLRKRYGGQRWRKLKGIVEVRLGNGSVRWAEITGTKRSGWAAGFENQSIPRLSIMTIGKSTARFVLCVQNDGSDDIETRKVYQILPDRSAVRDGYVRVIDESGEDYLYPSEYFVPAKLPVSIAQELMARSIDAMEPAAPNRRPG